MDTTKFRKVQEGDNVVVLQTSAQKDELIALFHNNILKTTKKGTIARFAMESPNTIVIFFDPKLINMKLIGETYYVDETLSEIDVLI